MFANSSKTKCTHLGSRPAKRLSAHSQRVSSACCMRSANTKSKVESVSDIDANTATFAFASPMWSRAISSKRRGSRISAMSKGFMRTLHEIMMDLRVLPAATLNCL